MGKGRSSLKDAEAQEDMQIAQGNRLREARLAAGFKTAAEALTALERVGLEIRPSTYYQYESGERRYLHHAQKFAEHYGVQPEFLLYGTVQKKRRVAVRGSIGANGIVLRSKGRTTDTVEAPPGEDAGNLVAYRVRDTNIAGYGDGDVIFYDGITFSEDPNPESLVGKDCIVEDSDGETYLACVVSAMQTGGLLVRRPSGRQRITVVHAAPIRWVKKD